jgi:hypothetical protein
LTVSAEMPSAAEACRKASVRSTVPQVCLTTPTPRTVSTRMQVLSDLQPKDEELGVTAKETAKAKKRWETGSSSSGGARGGGKATTRISKKRDDIHVPLVLELYHLYYSRLRPSRPPGRISCAIAMSLQPVCTYPLLDIHTTIRSGSPIPPISMQPTTVNGTATPPRGTRELHHHHRDSQLRIRSSKQRSPNPLGSTATTQRYAASTRRACRGAASSMRVPAPARSLRRRGPMQHTQRGRRSFV